MADQTDREAEVSQAAAEYYQKLRDEQHAAAEDAREELASETRTETQEEYNERVTAARASGIFGDLDTTDTANPVSGQDVVSADNEQATVEVAKADAAAEQGNEEAANLTPDEARRQVDVDAGTTESAQAADEGAAVQAEALADPNANQQQVEENDADDDLSAKEKVDKIKDAATVEEVDRLAEGDERVTVRNAADKKREELS